MKTLLLCAALTAIATTPSFADSAKKITMANGIVVDGGQVLLGDAVNKSDTFLTKKTGGSHNLEWAQKQAELVVIPEGNDVAATFASQNTGNDNDRAISIVAITKNASRNKSATSQAIYAEAVRVSPKSGNATGIEVDAANMVPKGGRGDVNPFQNQLGVAMGVWVASGADAKVHAPTYPAQTAVSVVNNGNTWDQGLVLKHNSLTPTQSALTKKTAGRAIEMAPNHHVSWYSNADKVHEAAAIVGRNSGALEIHAEQNISADAGQDFLVAAEDEVIVQAARVALDAQKSIQITADDAPDSFVRMTGRQSAQLEASGTRVAANAAGLSVAAIAQSGGEPIFFVSKEDSTLYIYNIPTNPKHVKRNGVYADPKTGVLKIKLH
ncbi:hypothetical protein [Shimia thalassica]|uniref:hypothetical protein n=1 Tax=Shimia thalassica TaxID=1715693 RepID=UPI0026E1CF47|nr:hypothetical protein [Shimia thalassica]MDO6483634.1 hypothetical protein [Shimia thalassica]